MRYRITLQLEKKLMMFQISLQAINKGKKIKPSLYLTKIYNSNSDKTIKLLISLKKYLPI